MNNPNDAGDRYRLKPLLDRPAVQPLEDEGPRIEISGYDTSGSAAHALLKAVYMNPDQPLGTRIRCAALALPFEMPKLAVSDGRSGNRDFAQHLEAARRRSASPALALVPNAPDGASDPLPGPEDAA